MVAMARGWGGIYHAMFIFQPFSTSFQRYNHPSVTLFSHTQDGDNDGDGDDDDDRVIKLIIGDARLILINSLAKVEP